MSTTSAIQPPPPPRLCPSPYLCLVVESDAVTEGAAAAAAAAVPEPLTAAAAGGAERVTVTDWGHQLTALPSISELGPSAESEGAEVPESTCRRTGPGATGGRHTRVANQTSLPKHHFQGNKTCRLPMIMITCAGQANDCETPKTHQICAFVNLLPASFDGMRVRLFFMS